MSTVESVDLVSGQSANPTKSLCNPYVFNTAITRAQSLVVASGNPFTLLAVEAKMPHPKYCWKEFLKFCKRNKTCFVMGIGQDVELKRALDSALKGEEGNYYHLVCYLNIRKKLCFLFLFAQLFRRSQFQ